MAKNKTIKDKTNVTGEMVTKAFTGKVQTFSKAQLVRSRRYINRRDALNALLKDGKTYSLAEVDEILKKFEGGN